MADSAVILDVLHPSLILPATVSGPQACRMDTSVWWEQTVVFCEAIIDYIFAGHSVVVAWIVTATR